MNSMDTLLVFGDSWPYGSGLNSDQKAFGQLLSESMNIKNFKNQINFDHFFLYLIKGPTL
jgi:hypothetical protein